MKKSILLILFITFGQIIYSQPLTQYDSTNSPIQNIYNHSLVCHGSYIYISDNNDIIYNFDGVQYWSADTLGLINGNNPQVKKLVKGGDNNIYALCDLALYVMNSSGWSLVLVLDSLTQNKKIAIDSTSAIWFFPNNTDTAFLRKFDNSILSSYPIPSNLIGSGLWANSNHTLWGLIDDSLNVWYSNFAKPGYIKFDGSSFSFMPSVFNVSNATLNNGEIWTIMPSGSSWTSVDLFVLNSNGIDTFTFVMNPFFYPDVINPPILKDGKLEFITPLGGFFDPFDIISIDTNGISYHNLPNQHTILDSGGIVSDYDIYGNFWFITGWHMNPTTDYTRIWRLQKGTYNIIKGHAFYDYNSNGQHDSNEPALPNVDITLHPQNISYKTQTDGQFLIPIAATSGTYQITASLPSPWSQTSTPDTFNIIQTQAFQVDSGFSFGFYSPPNLDLQLNGSAGTFRTGSTGNYHLVVTNYSSAPIDSLELSLNHDLQINFSQSIPTQNSYAGNTVKWYIDSLNLFESKHFYAEFLVPTSLTPPAALSSTANVTFLDTTLTLTDAYVINHQVTAPYDPNNKLVYQHNILECVNTGDTLFYTINFQNIGNDTAFNVMILDTLSPFLDLNTLSFSGSSNDYTYSLNGNILEIKFDDINLVDSTTNLYGSMGFINFYIVVDTYNPDIDSAVYNMAHIHFDFVAPVATNNAYTLLCNSVSLKEYDLNTIKIYPNPVNDQLFIDSDVSIENLSYHILSIDGKILYSGRFKSDFKNAIALGDLSQGTYILKFVSNGLFVSKIFFK